MEESIASALAASRPVAQSERDRWSKSSQLALDLH
jgi:hypothetical protein